MTAAGRRRRGAGGPATARRMLPAGIHDAAGIAVDPAAADLGRRDHAERRRRTSPPCSQRPTSARTARARLRLDRRHGRDRRGRPAPASNTSPFSATARRSAGPWSSPRHDWILSLDADEVLDDEAPRAIAASISPTPTPAGQLRRRTFVGRPRDPPRSVGGRPGAAALQPADRRVQAAARCTRRCVAARGRRCCPGLDPALQLRLAAPTSSPGRCGTPPEGGHHAAQGPAGQRPGRCRCGALTAFVQELSPARRLAGRCRGLRRGVGAGDRLDAPRAMLHRGRAAAERGGARRVTPRVGPRGPAYVARADAPRSTPASAACRRAAGPRTSFALATRDDRSRGSRRGAPAARAGAGPAGSRRNDGSMTWRPLYSPSQSTGQPIAARCTRIWCVRPVWGVSRTSAAARNRSTTSNRVTASRLVAWSRRTAIFSRW